jgi:hypothetical protein
MKIPDLQAHGGGKSFFCSPSCRICNSAAVNISIYNASTHLINPYGSGMAGEVGLAIQSFHSASKKELAKKANSFFG